jgi:hypothetical protein
MRRIVHLLLALVVALAGCTIGCDNSGGYEPADEAVYEYRYPDGTVETSEWPRQWSLVEEDYLTPEQWNSPEHQEALKTVETD